MELASFYCSFSCFVRLFKLVSLTCPPQCVRESLCVVYCLAFFGCFATHAGVYAALTLPAPNCHASVCAAVLIRELYFVIRARHC